MFVHGSKMPLTKFKDETEGTSNTFMVGEAYRKDIDANYTNWISGVGGERRPGRWFGMAADDQTACVVRQLRTSGSFAVNGGSFNAFASANTSPAMFTGASNGLLTSKRIRVRGVVVIGWVSYAVP